MNEEELERLYMDIYDNGIFDYGYKEKFKRYINNRLGNLEKENAELKVSCKIQVDTAFQTIYEKDNQLTKAKEFLHKVCYEFGIYDKDLMEEAKQFLKEVEKL